MHRAGYAIGSLCAIDRRPRDFGAEHVAAIGDFALLLQEILQNREIAAEANCARRLAAQRERLFRSTFEQAAVGISHTSLSGQVLRINSRVCTLLGYSPAELQSTSFIDITHPDDVERNMELFRCLVAGDIDNYRMEKRFLCKSGEYLWTQLSVGLVRSDHGDPDYIISVIEDISQRKALEEELISNRDSLQREVQLRTRRLEDNNRALQLQIKRALESERTTREAQARMRAIANSVPALIGYWDRDLRCEFANHVYQEWYGLDPQTTVGLHMAEVLGQKVFALNEPHARAALAGRAQHFERDLTKADGTEIHVDANYLPDFDEAGAVRGFFVLVTDVTSLRRTQLALEQANAKLRNDSQTDFLTGLANRRIFSERSEAALRRFGETGESYGLILLDLDDFKQINDRHGHAVGDEVLRRIGRVLKDAPRGLHDVAARLGGEEFALLCFGDLNEEVLLQIGERMRAAICAERLPASGGLVQFTGSLGVALSSSEDTDWKNIYARADAALYEAKLAGKNRVVFGRTPLIGSTARVRTLRLHHA